MKGKYVYSHALDEMVLERFMYHGQVYIWNDIDMVYYSEDSDEDWFQEVPEDICII